MKENDNYLIKTPNQLKDWIKNVPKKNNIVANTVLQNFMLERFLERVSLSRYRDNFILKGGFLIAAMVGIDMRSTMDMDTTIKGLSIDKDKLEDIIKEIITIPLNDNVTFEIMSVKPIRDTGEYDDFRISIVSHFFTMKVNLKLDITTGDAIIPKEIDYSFKLLFENRDIQIKAYNLNTILAEKIESILVRNVANTRARDFYDIYILFKLRSQDIDKAELLLAIKQKAEERKSDFIIMNYNEILKDIKESKDLKAIWSTYTIKYPYAKNIEYSDIVEILCSIFKEELYVANIDE